jgi:hypothetical protein
MIEAEKSCWHSHNYFGDTVATFISGYELLNENQ